MITIRLEYLRNVRKLRLIEYLKGACIRPEWMVISLLPVLPPDLRPIIANPRGYITGDINMHYQNIVYRNNNLERLSNYFWIPRKLVSINEIFSWPLSKNQTVSSKFIQNTTRFEKPGSRFQILKSNQNNPKSFHFVKNQGNHYLTENRPFSIFSSGFTSSSSSIIKSGSEIQKLDHWDIKKKMRTNSIEKTKVEKEFLNHLGSNFLTIQNLNDLKPLQEMQCALQKAVTALIDNNQKMQSNVLLRKGRPLKSLSDQLKGKEGRFRQHLLGKRVDYSARSVIIVGPTLKLYECGIPIIMALRLFQPFLIIYLINRFKIASLLATQLIQQKHPIVINILKKFIETWPILLNRAPTLHRMNIQSFKMKLVQGKAILLHPLVCSSFNADFDGDQMGVHVPITQQARAEAWKLLWSVNNSIGLASRQPLFLPTQDMVIGNFYLTRDSFPYYQTNTSLISKNRQIDEPSFNLNLNHQDIFSPTLIPNPNGPNTNGGILTQFGIEEAYQYYLNQNYRVHVNTPCWFSSKLKFELPEREKAIEIFIDKQGYSTYLSHYYEKKLKRNRFFITCKTENDSFILTPLRKSKNFSFVSDPKKNKINQSLKTYFDQNKEKITENPKQNNRKSIANFFYTVEFKEIEQFYFKKICMEQMIRSTFGRIEFYLHTLGFFEST
nr:RNA polymerase beta' subunit [Trentepohlia sp. YN1242]